MQASVHSAFPALGAGGHEFISGERQEAAQSTQLISRQRIQLEVFNPLGYPCKGLALTGMPLSLVVLSEFGWTSGGRGLLQALKSF